LTFLHSDDGTGVRLTTRIADTNMHLHAFK